ncbi:MAG: serpin family protein, partial [Bacteroidales bacterium]|nr:serpin family protein [Bacteroidales bacterium]
MSKIKLICLGFASMLMLAACSDEPNENGESNLPNGKVNSALVEQSNHFAMKLFATANNQNPNEENLVLSPLSLNMALAMLSNGANGQTKEGILSAMGMSNYNLNAVNDYFQTLRQTFQTADPNTQLALANSIWYRLGFPVKQSFIDVNTTYYDALVQELDFSNPSSADIINQWCSDKTNGLITEMVESPINDALVMFLINALYFKSTWADGYAFDNNGTHNMSFTKENGQDIQVQMMSQSKQLKHYQDNTLEMLTIPYGNKSFSMTFVLPARQTSVTNMLNALQQNGYWNSCLSHMEKKLIDVRIPRFKVRYDSERKLNSVLASLGMSNAFNSQYADFSNLSNVPIFVDFVKQKTYIDVNETGTEAAAVTVIGGATSVDVGPPTFFVNRPFLFVIQEESTGVVLFMGKIGNPEYEGK